MGGDSDLKVIVFRCTTNRLLSADAPCCPQMFERYSRYSAATAVMIWAKDHIKATTAVLPRDIHVVTADI